MTATPIPATLNDAVDWLVEHIPGPDLHLLASTPDDKLRQFHGEFGRKLRSVFRLTNDSSNLNKWFVSQGVVHQDDMVDRLTVALADRARELAAMAA